MQRNQKLWLVSLSLIILGTILLFIAINSERLKPAWPLVVVALAVVLLGVGFDIWRRSTPGQTGIPFDLSAHPRVASVLFTGVMLV